MLTTAPHIPSIKNTPCSHFILMANITVCSTSTPSATLPATVSIPSPSATTKSSSLKITHHFHTHPVHLSYAKLNLDLDSDNNNVSFSTATSALTLARESLASAYEAEVSLCSGEGRDWRNGCLIRRKKRMKRRKGSEFESSDDDKVYPFMAAAAATGKYLTSKEEAEYSMYVKEEARLESVRRKIIESSEREPTTMQWANAVGMRSCTLNKTICSGKESQERIIRCYRRLVVSIASSYQGKGLSLQDLIQEGSIGLMYGVKKFDPEKGYKLSTYIYYWIKQAVIKAIAEKSRIIRLPGNICSKLPKIAEANKKLRIRLRRLPSYEEIAQAVEMDVSTVRLISRRVGAPLSFDQELANRGCIGLQEIMSGPKEATPEAMVERQHLRQDLEKLLTRYLSDREAIVLRLFYGLNGETAQSCEEIGRLFKISRERVRQLRRLALSKLQQSSMIHHLKVYIM